MAHDPFWDLGSKLDSMRAKSKAAFDALPPAPADALTPEERASLDGIKEESARFAALPGKDKAMWIGKEVAPAALATLAGPFGRVVGSGLRALPTAAKVGGGVLGAAVGIPTTLGLAAQAKDASVRDDNKAAFDAAEAAAAPAAPTRVAPRNEGIPDYLLPQGVRRANAPGVYEGVRRADGSRYFTDNPFLAESDNPNLATDRRVSTPPALRRQFRNYPANTSLDITSGRTSPATEPVDPAKAFAAARAGGQANSDILAGSAAGLTNADIANAPSREALAQAISARKAASVGLRGDTINKARSLGMYDEATGNINVPPQLASLVEGGTMGPGGFQVGGTYGGVPTTIAPSVAGAGGGLRGGGGAAPGLPGVLTPNTALDYAQFAYKQQQDAINREAEKAAKTKEHIIGGDLPLAAQARALMQPNVDPYLNSTNEGLGVRRALLQRLAAAQPVLSGAEWPSNREDAAKAIAANGLDFGDMEYQPNSWYPNAPMTGIVGRGLTSAAHSLTGGRVGNRGNYISFPTTPGLSPKDPGYHQASIDLDAAGFSPEEQAILAAVIPHDRGLRRPEKKDK